MNAAQGVLSKVVDLKQLQVIPGITKEKTSENTRKLLVLAETIASGDPSAAFLDDLDFTPCYQISRDHLWHWGDENYLVRSFQFVLLLVPIFSLRYGKSQQNASAKFYGKVGNKICNIIADTLLSRSSVPHYIGEKAAYPPKQDGTSKALRETNRALDGFMLGGSNDNKSKKVHIYNSPQLVTELLAQTGLVDTGRARTVLYRVFPKWDTSNAWNPDTTENLGMTFHLWQEHDTILSVVALACYGCFKGHRAWMRLNKVLIQGGWPWLRGYNKAMAKAVFLVMVSLFGALELGYVNAGVAEDLTALARLLVGRDGSGWPLRVRRNNRLQDKKVRVAAVEKKNPDAAGKESGQTDPTAESEAQQQKWILNTIPVTRTLDSPSPRHIIPGRNCNHGECLRYNGRVRVAHSLKEVEEQITGDWGITVALTLGAEAARSEVEAYAIQEKILSVKRADEQCIYCAYRLAHATCALLVIG